MKNFHITYFIPQGLSKTTERTLTGVTIESLNIVDALDEAINSRGIKINLIKYIIEL